MPKKGGLGQFADLRGGLGKKEGLVFLKEGGLIPQCKLCSKDLPDMKIGLYDLFIQKIYFAFEILERG